MRKALLIGVGTYDRLSPAAQLTAPPNDARAMGELLRADDAAIEGAGAGIRNYDCQVFATPEHAIGRAFVDERIDELLRGADDVLFFFAGHGKVVDGDLRLMVQDSDASSPGISSNVLIDKANKSPATSVVMILDCCHAGQAGPGNEAATPDKPGKPAKPTGRGKPAVVTLRENRTIIAAARSGELSWEEGKHGIFTDLLLAGLRGGAADPRGYVTASSLHGYAEFALGAWDQRPIYKSHASSAIRLRRSAPRVPDDVLLRLPRLFPGGKSIQLDPTYEWDDKNKDPNLERSVPERVADFDDLKLLRNAGLIRCDLKPGSRVEMDLYHCAIYRKWVHLTALGHRFWQIVERGALR